MPTPTGWVPSQLLNGMYAQPPPEVIAAMQGRYDPSVHQWNPQTMTLTGPEGEYYFGADSYNPYEANPANGTNVVIDGVTQNFAEGVTPYSFLGGGQAITVAEGSPEYHDLRADARTRNQQGLARIATLVGGGAALGATGSGPVFGGSGAAGTAAQTFPYSAGGPVTVSSIPGVTAGTAGTAGAGVAVADGLTGVPSLPPGVDYLPTGGGGMWENLLGGLRGNWGTLAGGLFGAIDANNQPDSMTSSYAPDPALTGAGQDVLAQLRALFANGGPGVADIDPASLAAIQGLQGFADGSGINPYLNTVFNTAADATRGRLSSEFARSGRNVNGVDHEGYRSDELQQLAAGIYGQGYENERQRQYGSLLPLLGAGDYSRSITQQQLDQPLTNAMRYSGGLNSLLPLFPGTNTQPLFNNPWAGFLGGAQLGSLFSGG